MKNTLNYLGVLLVGIIIGIVCSIVVRSKLAVPIRGVITDTTTVIIYDTVRIKEPQPTIVTQVTATKFTSVPTLLTITDTVKVPYYVRDTLIIPIEQKYYTGESYKAWISGYNPKLDSILIYNATRTVTIENTLKNTARNTLYLSGEISYIHPFPAMTVGVRAGFSRDRWGLYIGGGTVFVPDGLKWYGVAGLQYDLLTKQW